MATSIYKTILKRSTCLNSIEEHVVDPCKKYDNIVGMIENANNIKSFALQGAIKQYIDSMCNCENASKYYWQPLDLASRLNAFDENFSNSCIIHNYINRVLPYVESMGDVIYSIDNKNDLTKDQKDTLYEAARNYAVADRISNNHKSISNRFNIERENNRYKAMGLKFLVESIGNMVSTYSVDNYQKMNITIEETYYFLNKNGIDYNDNDLIKYTLEYYLTQSPYISDSEIKKYDRVISESYVVDSSVIDFNTKDCSTINKMVESYIFTNTKEIDNLSSMVEKTLANTTKDDIIYNAESIAYLCWDLAKNKVFESDESLYSVSNLVVDAINDGLEKDAKSYSKEDIGSLINSLTTVKEYVYNSGNSSDYNTASAKFIAESLNPLLEKLSDIEEIVYNKSNLDVLSYFENFDQTYAFDRFDHTRYYDLVRETFGMDKFLNVKEGRIARDNVFTSGRKAIFESDINGFKDNITSYIGSDNTADICIRQYTFNEGKINEASNFLKNVCNEYNDILTARNNVSRAYYTINPGYAEIRMKDPTKIAMTEEVKESVMNEIDPSICLYVNDILESGDKCSEVGSIKPIETMIAKMSKCEEFTYEQFKLALEAMSIIGIDPSVISAFAEKFNDYNFNAMISGGAINESYLKLANQEHLVNEDVNEYNTLDEASFEDKLEAYNCLSAIFEYSYPDSADDDDDDDDYDDDEDEEEDEKKDKKESGNNKEAFDKLRDENKHMAKEVEKETIEHAPGHGKKKYKAKFNINDIKLALMGIKSKAKDLSTKDKEISNNLDNAMRALVKGIKDSLVSDRREAIIKGSVIPSFSRCIKAAIGLAVVAHFSPAIAAIGAVGALALSKKLTDKERILLLDEIETEIEVVDKELALADSNNQIQKYRTLLTYKKDLQRQYQRIKYNIRIGKDILPGSSAGFKSEESS